jgi:DNA polymerase
MNPTAAARQIDLFHGSPLTIISSCLRGMICAAPGHDLLAADYSNIEGRGLAWLAGEERKLQVFRDSDAGTGPDPYLVAAARAYNVNVATLNKKSPERQPGKVMELAFGYQGGVGAWRKMEAAAPGMPKFTDDQVQEFKTAWRALHPKIEKFWYDLEEAAAEAVRMPGTTTKVGVISFRVKGSFLWCRLPSGRVLCYPYPKIKPIETPWGEVKDQVSYHHVDGLSNKWIETHTYGGKLAENVTQAICRDLLAYSIRQAEDAGYPVVLHVHDEVVSEVPKGFGSLEQFESICARTPAWAEGLPVVTEGWRGGRYRK